MSNNKPIYIDKNHRIRKGGDFFIPEYRPYLFRTWLFYWMGGWSTWGSEEKVKDSYEDDH